MSWRRFTTGSFGGLSARQYTEVQDAVRSLVGDLGGRSVPGLDMPRPMLVRIKERLFTSTAGPGTVAGSQRVVGAAYKFEQAFVRVTDSAIEIAKREYGLESRNPASGNEQDRAIAIDLTANSDIAANTIATVYPAAIDMGDERTQVPQRQSVFVVVGGQGGGDLKVYTVVGALANAGMYRVSSSDSEFLDMENLYETSNYYGALSPPQNPCAELMAKLLPDGSRVLGAKIGNKVFCCAPNAFSVVCVNCGANPGGALASTYDAVNGEASAVGMMLKGL